MMQETVKVDIFRSGKPQLVTLTGSCIGCQRVTWLCRRDRKCSKYSIKPFKKQRLTNNLIPRKYK